MILKPTCREVQVIIKTKIIVTSNLAKLPSNDEIPRNFEHWDFVYLWFELNGIHFVVPKYLKQRSKPGNFNTILE